METEESRDLEAEAAELEERERTLEARKRDLEAEKKALRAEAASLEGAEVKSKKPDKVTLVSVSNVEEEEINWLYPPYVPRGKITLCAAYPGTGKTYLLCYMAACVSTGRSFFNLIPFKDEPGKVIYLTSEDGIGDTIKKRLRICGANTDNVFTVPDGQNNLLFDSPEIEEFIKQIKPALMIFDPFQSYIGKEVDMNAANKTRERLNCIVSLAQKYNVAVVIICHFNKNGKGDAITRVMGSTDIMGICRSYIALGNVPGEEDIKYMSHGEQRNTGTDASNRHDSKTFQSNEQSKLGSGQTLVPGGICWDACRQAARTRAIQRPYACYADAFGRPGGMEEDLYNG